MPADFESAIIQFLRYLKNERNASELTIKSYREDLTILNGYFIESMGLSLIHI